MSSVSPLFDDSTRISIPFASGKDAIRSSIPVAQPIGISSMPNLSDGFPSAYSNSRSAGGKYVSRGDMNAIGYMSTSNIVRMQRGGINTYNPKLVEMMKQKNGGEIGGYAKDSILDWWNEQNQVFCKVISLVDNNDYDFTARNENGFSIGPDDVHWRICSESNMWIPDYNHGQSIGGGVISLSLPTSLNYVSSQYEMPFDGYLSINVDATYTIPCSLFAAGDPREYTYHVNSVGSLSGQVFWSVSITGKWKYYGVITGDAYDKCRHSLYLAMSESGNVSVDMENLLDGNSDSTVIHVSSSGTEGSGGCGLIPVRKGTKFRFVGYQTYTLAEADTTLYINSQKGNFPQFTEYYNQVITGNNLSIVGRMTIKAKVTAFPTIG